MAPAQTTILQIIPHLETGGAELSAIEIAEALVMAGARAIVATQGGRLVGRLAAVGGELLQFPAATKNPLKIFANARELTSLVGRERISLIHARSRAPAWSARLATRRTGVPFVTTYHGAYAERGPLKRLYNSVMARADRVIANSAYTALLIEGRYGVPEDRIRIIHRGVDLAHFDPAVVAPDRIARLRAEWRVGEDQPVILHAARLTDWKGQRILIEAAGGLRMAGRLGNAVVVLAGDDQGRTAYRRELADLAAANGVADAVRMPGHVDDIVAAFAAAHIAVVASIEPEAFGRAATEAQAMRCPVIATDIGAPPETVLAVGRVGPDTATGWLVPPGKPLSLAVALSQALSLAPDERARLGERARAHIARSFTLDAMKRATLAVYDELLGTRLAAAFDAATASR